MLPPLPPLRLPLVDHSQTWKVTMPLNTQFWTLSIYVSYNFKEKIFEMFYLNNIPLVQYSTIKYNINMGV